MPAAPAPQTRTRRRRARIARLTVAGLTVALALVMAAAPAPLSSGPRPSLGYPLVPSPDRYDPPAPMIDERFATLPFTDSSGRPGTWVLSDSVLPLQVVVEQEAVDRYGLDRIRTALTAWNDVDGSRFGVEIAGVVDERVGVKAQDGVHRVFLDRRDCEERYLARAHLYPARVEARGARSVAWVDEVDIGLCDRLTPERFASVIRHEVAHLAGLGHLCDLGSDCWTPEMDEDNHCRIMSPAAYPCQEPSRGDADGLVYLHPRLPRVSGQDRIGTAAAVSYLAFPDPRAEDHVLLTDVDAPAELKAAATVLAGVRGIPHLLVDGDCVQGSDAAELNRVAAMDAEAILVGDVGNACEDALRLGWGLRTSRLEDTAAVTRATVEEVGEPRRLVVTVAPDEASSVVSDVTLAAPAAVGLRAPLVTTGPGSVSAIVRETLEANPSITGVVLVGDTRRLTSEVSRVIEQDLGVRVRRLDAPDTFEVAADLSRMRDVFGPDPLDVVLVAIDRREDALAAAQLAAHIGGAVFPIYAGPGAPDVRVATLLRERVADGFVVGGPQAVPVDLHLALSRAVDLAR